MAGTFFTSWQLWEEMTFVLACAIVIVFLLGLFKLWRTNRILRRQERIDEEKKARIGEMRRVGLPSHKKRTNDIPFGIRAIQTGVEVDGIWISKPATSSPNGDKGKGKKGPANLEDAPASPREAAGASEPSPASEPLPQISETTAFLPNTRNVPIRVGLLNEEALRHLESHSHSPTATRVSHTTTYVPSSSQNAGPSNHKLHNYQHLQQQPSTSTSDHYRPDQHVRTASVESAYVDCNSSIASSHSLSVSSRQEMGEESAAPGDATGATTKETGYSHYNQPPSPFRIPKGPYGIHPALRTEPLPADTAAGNPATTFGPGDSFANRASRRINSGFEVLPAGTFGGPSVQPPDKPGDNNGNDKTGESTTRRSTIQSGRRKLRKAGPS